MDEDTELADLRAEYGVTVRVLAVVVELLLTHVGGDCIEISDDNLERSPTLRAWREPARKSVAIAVDRDDGAGVPGQ